MLSIMVILSLFLPFLMHVLFTRSGRFYKQAFSRQKGVIVSFLCGFPVVLLLFFIWYLRLGIKPLPGVLCSALYLFSIYTLFGYIYFHFFNMSETARRIRILEEVYKSGVLKKDTLVHLYTCQEMVTNRLKRLIALGELRLSGERYLVKRGILLIPARMALILRNILFPETGPYLKPNPRLLFFLFFTTGLTIALEFSKTFNAFLGNYQHEFFAVLVGLISLLSLRFLNKKGSFVNYLLICIPYILSILGFLFSSDLPIWDSWRQHFCAFRYIGNAIASGHIFPEWFPSLGGIRIGFFHINYFSFLPHRILGYYLYSMLPVSVIFAYKLQYILGIIFMCFGWWLVLQKITNCQYAAYFGTLMIMMGGTGITFHQEQLLATTYLIPWFILSLLKIKDNSMYIFPLVLLFGMGLSTHYPQIQSISMGLIILSMALYKPSVVKNIYNNNKCFIFIIILLFILALLPSYYIFYNVGNLNTFIRGIIAPQTYQDYLNLNLEQQSSVKAVYYYQYINPIIRWAEREDIFTRHINSSSFFVGRIALIVAFMAMFLKLRKVLPIILLLIIFVALSFGVNCIIPIPKYLFLMHFPFINTFRQWYYFFPMVNFCLSALAAIGLAYLIKNFHNKLKVFFGILLALIIFFQIVDLSIYDRKYVNTFVFHKDMSMPAFRIPDYAFSREDQYPGLVGFLPNSLFQYKNRYRLYRSCKEAIPVEPFLTTNIVNVTDGIDKELEKTFEILREEKGFVVINAPKNAFNIPEKDGLYTKVSGPILVKPDGISMDIIAPQSSFLVTPLNYDLGLKAYSDGREIKVWRVNSALSGVFVDKGGHNIQFNVRSDMYLPILVVQIFLYIFLFLFFLLI